MRVMVIYGHLIAVICEEKIQLAIPKELTPRLPRIKYKKMLFKPRNTETFLNAQLG